ncbi:S-layer homology domain-containing protein [Paenibacillus sp. 1781tsa1]|uniref:S-layer homology domain-containing protein n=1 Tax=Paenibacillus sp. 1781tsa1 TaxID=2953810 RepID=UPI00209DDBF7|nr:S-layer homology domain-containing protein [Paenibacillus sp. 1781tsa1]MCP1186537.1 S-layer homology domain-containing protein [Paenibacillus sp. 1781tsa1]
MKKVTQLILSGALVIGIFPFTGNTSQAAVVSFKDVPTTHWAKASIDAAVEKGYFKGYSDGTFKPGATVTRAEFAALLARVAKGATETEQANVFKDLTGHWSEVEVNRAVSFGFLKSSDYPNGFKPGTALTREEMAKWLSSGLAAQDEDYKQALKDTENTLVPVAEYYKGGLKKAAYPYVSVVLGTGLMSGYPDGTFGPGKTTTRAEAAVILSRYDQVQESKADSYRDLNEMREVGLTGSNLTTATPYEYFTREDGTAESFDRVIGKKVNLRNNLGTITAHRMIVADAQTKTTIRNLYGKLFIDKNYSNPIDEQYYEAFMEVTVTPSGNNLRNLAFVQAVGGIFRTISNFSSGTTEKYGISNLPVEEYVDSGFFKEGVPRTFWMNFLLIRSAGTSSQSRVTFVVDKDTGMFFRIP